MERNSETRLVYIFSKHSAMLNSLISIDVKVEVSPIYIGVTKVGFSAVSLGTTRIVHLSDSLDVYQNSVNFIGTRICENQYHGSATAYMRCMLTK